MRYYKRLLMSYALRYFVCALVLLASITTVINRARIGAVPIPVSSELGQPLATLFDGIKPIQAFRELAEVHQKRSGRCNDKLKSSTGLGEKLMSLIEGDVYASDCGCTGSNCPCAGAYFFNYQTQCTACDTIFRQTVTQDPERGSPCMGWKYTGNKDCANCICTEESCPTCG